MGCGTGLSLPAIQRAIGPSGTAIALEPCPQMLAQAMRRAGEHGWSNVIPINATAEDADLPGPVDAVLFCATHDVLRSRRALAAVFAHLRLGGRWRPPGASRSCPGPRR
ncbi:MAG: class I SAM-dependent methyltransferase [Actinomycetota bacterium]|nr:class I SAM-dependent methyltransferase [Actinomycetota bacterium]